MFQTVRDIVWSMSNDELRTFVEKSHNKEIDGQLDCSVVWRMCVHIHVHVSMCVCVCVCVCAYYINNA